MEEYKQVIQNYFVNNNHVHLYGFNGYVRLYLHRDGFSSLAKIVYDNIQLSELQIFLRYLDFVSREPTISNFLGNTIEAALSLYEYSKIYTNLPENLIKYCYSQHILHLLRVAETYKKIRKDHRIFLQHRKECRYGKFEHCSCEFTQEEKIIGFEKLLKYEHNDSIHPIWNLWELSEKEYTNYSQWLPRELIDMNLEYYSGNYVIDPNTYIY